MHKVSGASTKVYWGDGELQEIHCSWLVSENRPISFQFNRIISRLCGCEAVVHCTHKSTEYTLVPCKSVLNNQIVIGRNSFANRIMPLWFIFIPWCSRVSPSYPPTHLPNSVAFPFNVRCHVWRKFAFRKKSSRFFSRINFCSVARQSAKWLRSILLIFHAHPIHPFVCYIANSSP